MPRDDSAARAAGIDPAALDALHDRVRREVDEGRLPSCQFAVARHGSVVATGVYGDAGEASRYVIFSATKPVVAATVWTLLAEGALDLAQRVGDVIPEFATNGKEGITVEQVMLHTSGFPHAPLGAPQWQTREQRLEVMGRWRLNWEPGSRFEYHPTSAHWVLAELIERATGDDYRRVVRARVLDPLGLDRLELGVPPERQHDIRDLELRGEPPTPEELAAVGIDAMPVTEVTPEALLMFNRPEVRAVGVPGGGGVSDAASLARFYQALLDDRAGLFDPALLADATGRVRNRHPDYLGVPANRTIGLVVAGDDGRSNLRGMGRTVSPRAFGHNGAAGQIAWGDPVTGVSFVFLTNGVEQHVLREWRRTASIASRAGALVPRP